MWSEALTDVTAGNGSQGDRHERWPQCRVTKRARRDVAKAAENVESRGGRGLALIDSHADSRVALHMLDGGVILAKRELQVRDGDVVEQIHPFALRVAGGAEHRANRYTLAPRAHQLNARMRGDG